MRWAESIPARYQTIFDQSRCRGPDRSLLMAPPRFGAEMTYECILLETDANGVATLTLARPESLNAWNDTMEHEIQQALRCCDEDDEI